MSGYTPLYDTMLTGTLYGRWPHTGIWACLLSRASREGVIDEVPASLSAAIGVDESVLRDCINDFLKPDPGSRTKANEGRRLELIDPDRDWGWRVLNHGKYREKARKRIYDESRTESGSDADRKRDARSNEAASREVPTRPAKSRRVPLSEAEEKKKKETVVPTAILFDPFVISGLNHDAWKLWLEHRAAIKKPIRPHALQDAAEELAKHGSQQMAEVKRSRANGWQGIFPEKPLNGLKPAKDPYAGSI